MIGAGCGRQYCLSVAWRLVIARRSAVRDALRSLYRYESLGVHLIGGVSLLLPARSD